MELVPNTRLGAYEIVALIGSGGMGEVYQARDTRLDRVVALKVITGGGTADPDLRTRFEREARAISSLNHPNICVLHDIGRERPLLAPTGGTSASRPPSAEDTPLDFLVMEYLEGETLADRLARAAGSLDCERHAADDGGRSRGHRHPDRGRPRWRASRRHRPS